jgi:peptidoglycan hydrolase-like protein with peptidoglycan-binding domain
MTSATAPAAVTESEWGSPEFKTFKKRFIRIVRANGSTAWVHAEIAAIVQEVFTAAETPYGDVTAYDPESADLAARYGTYLPIPWTLELQRWGFGMHGEGIVFEGTIDDAHAYSEQAAVLAASREVKAAPPAVLPEQWANCLPGTRTIVPGDKGDDVQFLQLLGGLTDDGIYGPETEEFISYLRKRMGIPEAEVGEGDVVILADAAFWSAVLPKRTLYSMGQGDAGFKIRVLQAALAAADWAPQSLVTGRFGVETGRAVRRLQANCNLRITGRVRQAEWLALVDFGLQG